MPRAWQAPAGGAAPPLQQRDPLGPDAEDRRRARAHGARGVAVAPPRARPWRTATATSSPAARRRCATPSATRSTTSSSRLETPTKPATNARAGAVVDLVRRADLDDPPAVDDGDPVAHRQRLVLVVRDVDERDPDLQLDALELDLQLLAQLQIERTERLVEQQHRAGG